MKKKIFNVYTSLLNHFGKQQWWPAKTRFEVCVGAILTQNTAWTNVEKALNNIRREKSLSAKAFKDMPVEKLAQLIRPAGYFNVKADRLKIFIDYLYKNYGGSVKKMCSSNENKSLRDELLQVKGIGKETADSILLYAGDLPHFVIDAYTKRVFSRLGVCKKDISYDELQTLFVNNLPKDFQLFNEYHALIVMLGKHYCKKKPICDPCPLSGSHCSFSCI